MHSEAVRVRRSRAREEVESAGASMACDMAYTGMTLDI